MKAIAAEHPGEPQVMTLQEVPSASPAADEVLVDVAACGVNYIDTYQRSGVYSVDFPFTPGLEGAGVVASVGTQVDWAAPGDRVAWASTSRSYAQQVRLRRSDAYQVPEGVGLDVAAAVMLQGLTAHYLSASSFPLHGGHTALVHAGAGGVGLLLTQLAVARGARVITTVSGDRKEELSRATGATEVIRYERFRDIATELPGAIRALTDGSGVDVVYDGVGASTFDGSLASLAVRGTMVLFGGASGQVPAFSLQRLNSGGSLSITRPSLGHFLRTDEERAWRAGDLFSGIAAGDLDVRIGETFSLSQASHAHEALEGRRTTGKVLLLP
ncbi:quinone oxidoreductase family protein [Demequina activiva]|uniref:Quinone oxidoreductase n=1 Tax=Demequina activiva TaxID=1582364 RepID=A0A919UJH9_9MICO|nr:quinone oxidoreductase [Demequina activiva]GIG54386.1 quinone oxidoreductase [Demequina activiva]